MIRLFTPISFFLMGTFIGLLPLLVNNKYFELYDSFYLNYEIILVHLIGFISFIFGSILINIFFIKKTSKKEIPKKDLNFFISTIIFISLIFFIIIIKIYGSIPMISILIGNSDIQSVNEIEKETGNGIFGVLFLLIISLIILFPYSIINKNRNIYNKLLFYIYSILLLIYCTYSGKRQLLFVLFTYTFVYTYIYYYRIGDTRLLKKINYYGISFFLVIMLSFSLIGLIRMNILDGSTSILEPIIHYASLPFINLTSIISNQSNNIYALTPNAFFDTLLNDLPTLIKSIFITETLSLNDIPLLEPTSPSSLYGEIFWNFGYLGIIIYLFLIGMFSNYLYLKAIYSQQIFYISMYSFLIWPLLSIFMYNHFKNFMFLIIPLFLIYFFHKIYLFLPKKINWRNNANR